jgi:hypothetical protein
MLLELEMYPGKPLDVAALEKALRDWNIVTFYGNHYDIPMMSAALMGWDNLALKWLSDQIITRGLKSWNVEREYKVFAPAYIDHIDLIEVMPGDNGLKMYMAKMHSKRIQELPIPPDASIAPEMRPTMRTYCGNDLEGNIDALNLFATQIKLREEMSAEYGVDLRSKSDAQIAEAVFKKELGFHVEQPEWVVGSWFNYEPPTYVNFQTPVLQTLLHTVRNARFILGPSAVELPVELDHKKTPAANIRIGNSVYSVGLGGLHSQESCIAHFTDADNELVDIDVESYYPKFIINTGLYPVQCGPKWREIYINIFDKRFKYKAIKDPRSDSLKIVLNGTFGKLLSRFGILSAPKLGIQTTISGQLTILMLIERLELAGISVVSANTDGIVVKCPRHLLAMRDQIIEQWQRETDLKTEAVKYDAIYFYSVNSYVAFKTPTEKDPKPKAKLKGDFAEAKPVASSWPSPTGFICVEAIIAFLRDFVPIEQTIRACRDIRKFVYVWNVRDGGVKYYGEPVEAATTLGGMRQQLALTGWVEVEPKVFDRIGNTRGPLAIKEAHKIAFSELRERDPVRKEYLGRVVRWYYGAGMPGAIRSAKSGNLVPKTQGAKPCMELPDELPADIDYQRYICEAYSLLKNAGVPVAIP